MFGRRWRVRSLVGYEVEVLRTQNMGVVIEVVSVCEVTKRPPLRRFSRRRCKVSKQVCGAVRPDKSERAKVLRLDPSPFGPCLTRI